MLGGSRMHSLACTMADYFAGAGCQLHALYMSDCLLTCISIRSMSVILYLFDSGL